MAPPCRRRLRTPQCRTAPHAARSAAVIAQHMAPWPWRRRSCGLCPASVTARAIATNLTGPTGFRRQRPTPEDVKAQPFSYRA